MPPSRPRRQRAASTSRHTGRTPAARAGRGTEDGEPWRAIATTLRGSPCASCIVLPAPRTQAATVSRTNPTTPKTTRLVTAQCGIFAVKRTYATRNATGKRSNNRCANTVPSRSQSSPSRVANAAARPRPVRSRLRSPGARRFRASRSRMRRRPARTLGAGSGSAWSIVIRQESARAEHRDEVEEDPDDDPSPHHEVEGVVDGGPVGPTPPDGKERADERARERRRLAPTGWHQQSQPGSRARAP